VKPTKLFGCDEKCTDEAKEEEVSAGRGVNLNIGAKR
jgi:hypothetical protein